MNTVANSLGVLTGAVNAVTLGFYLKKTWKKENFETEPLTRLLFSGWFLSALYRGLGLTFRSLGRLGISHLRLPVPLKNWPKLGSLLGLASHGLLALIGYSCYNDKCEDDNAVHASVFIINSYFVLSSALLLANELGVPLNKFGFYKVFQA